MQIVDSVPFEEYQKKFDNSHVLIDQLYSYGCGLNGVLGMSKGMIVVGGADPYMYKLMGENENFPLVYLPIDKTEMLQALEILIKEKYTLHERAHRSREFAVKHHDYIKVAHEYVEFWKSKM